MSPGDTSTKAQNQMKELLHSNWLVFFKHGNASTHTGKVGQREGLQERCLSQDVSKAYEDFTSLLSKSLFTWS